MRAIFRAKALSHYIQGREQEIFPLYIAPPLVLLYWCLVAMLAAGILVLCLGRIPVYSEGIGLVRTTGLPDDGSRQIQFLLFFPVSQQQQIHREQAVTVWENGDDLTWSLRITNVFPQVMSPLDVRQRFALVDGTATLVKLPVVVAQARMDAPAGSDQSRFRFYNGSILQVRVETGSRTLISMMGV